ncbi:hypothetical protein GQ600_18488 [Phytophthora cactorum]|nr:hypothetical protein GQ600_18488 [Phytophthora cactorum]
MEGETGAVISTPSGSVALPQQLPMEYKYNLRAQVLPSVLRAYYQHAGRGHRCYHNHWDARNWQVVLLRVFPRALQLREPSRGDHHCFIQVKR